MYKSTLHPGNPIGPQLLVTLYLSKTSIETRENYGTTLVIFTDTKRDCLLLHSASQRLLRQHR